jgi:hypothetical protein
MAIQTAADSITSNQGSPFGFKNRIINGGMVIDQRNSGASVTPTSSTYTLDRWYFDISQSSKASVQQNGGSVTPPPGFTNYIGITSTSNYSIGADDYFWLSQFIEGYNIADLDWGKTTAKSVTLSFWVRSSLTGTFGGALQNSSSDRSYPFSYTIPGGSSNTWVYVSVTIPGDTTGTWLTTTGKGIRLSLGFGVGTNRSGTAGVWAATNYASSTGATSVVGTSGATFYVTGVQLEVGQQSTAFDYRPYGTELALCQRYLPAYPVQSGSHNAVLGMAYGAGTALWQFNFPVTPRVVPTGLTYTGTATNLRYYVGSSSGSVSSFAYNDATLQTGWASSGISASNAQCIMLATPTSESGVIYFTGCEL